MEEVWKPIKNWEGMYEVSSNGRVRSIRRIGYGGRIIEERIMRQTNNKNMKTKSETQKYIDEYIKSIVVERRGDKFYGTLTDKEGRTFEFSKYVLDIERLFSNTHRILYEDAADFKESMLLKYFQRLFVGVYAGRRLLVDLGIRKTI